MMTLVSFFFFLENSLCIHVNPLQALHVALMEAATPHPPHWPLGGEQIPYMKSSQKLPCLSHFNLPPILALGKVTDPIHVNSPGSSHTSVTSTALALGEGADLIHVVPMKSAIPLALAEGTDYI